MRNVLLALMLVVTVLAPAHVVAQAQTPDGTKQPDRMEAVEKKIDDLAKALNQMTAQMASLAKPAPPSVPIQEQYAAALHEMAAKCPPWAQAVLVGTTSDGSLTIGQCLASMTEAKKVRKK